MAGLSHFNTSKAAVNKFEPVYVNQFEVIVTPPPAVVPPPGIPGNGNIMLEQVKSVEGLQADINPGEITQQYRGAKRYYAGAAPDRTGFDLGINFEVNLDNNNSMYVYKVLRQWSDFIYNPLTGAMGLKIRYTGTITINIFNKEGDVHRRITCKDCFPSQPITPMDLRYTGTEIYSIRMQWAVDNFEDVFN